MDPDEPTEAQGYREQAGRARRLAKDADNETRARLLAVAEEYEVKARALEEQRRGQR